MRVVDSEQNSLLAARLKDISLTHVLGEERRLGNYWEKQPVVLEFVRHFG